MPSGRSAAVSRPGSAAHTWGITFTTRAAVLISPATPCCSGGGIGDEEVALGPGEALDHEVVAARPEGSGPVGGHRVVHPGDVLDEDPRRTGDDALQLEPQTRGRAGRDRAERGFEIVVDGDALGVLADLVEGRAERIRERVHDRAPREREHTGEEQHRRLVERLREAERLEHDLGLVVVLVVEDLGDADRVDALLAAEQRQRQEVIGVARVDA